MYQLPKYPYSIHFASANLKCIFPVRRHFFDIFNSQGTLKNFSQEMKLILRDKA